MTLTFFLLPRMEFYDIFFCCNFPQALDTIKKAGSNFPKDSAKRLEKEVSDILVILGGNACDCKQCRDNNNIACKFLLAG